MKKALPFLLISNLLIVSSCKVNYSFTGASISPDIKTFSVKYFQSYAPLAQPFLSQDFTEKLKDIFIAQTSLSLREKFGDLQFEGEITQYATTPIAITGNETAAQNRLTIAVKVKFTNTQDEEKNFERTFSKYEDFDSGINFADIEKTLANEIIDQLVQEIFNNAVSDW